ncbi:MAG: alpha/beta hydrolase [Xanthomonadales bacterium]|jgi:fermentation-respiration switch protein FrsA (DUF1100 family)|nr:alpha/beta hydrolase [Xanthomonadales bacterium]
MRTLVTILTTAISAYLLLALVLYLFQGKMVYLSDLPDRALGASPGDIGLDYEDVSLTTSDEERLHGWYIPAADSRGVLLFFHGNAGNISHRLDSIRIFHELDLDILIIDYRGYGQSTGHTTEQGTYLDAQAAWDYLITSRRVPADQIIIFGRSLGGAIGAWLSVQNTPAAVIIESSFSSGVDMAHRLYPFLPVRLITRLKYPVVDYAARLNCPVLVVHSRDDEIIPFDMGQAIYAAAKQKKTFLELGGDHNNGFLISQEDYIAGLKGFTQAILGP